VVNGHQSHPTVVDTLLQLHHLQLVLQYYVPMELADRQMSSSVANNDPWSKPRLKLQYRYCSHILEKVVLLVVSHVCTSEARLQSE